MAVTRHEARGNAREPDGGTPGRLGLANKIHCTVNIIILPNIDTAELERQIIIERRDRFRRSRMFRSGFE